MIIADTDVLIDFLRGKGLAERIAIELHSGDLHTTAISAFELLSGAKSQKEATVVETLLAAVTILPLDMASARKAAEVQQTLSAKKMTIGMADSLIAGICLERSGQLITHNRKHFERVSGLKLILG